MKPAWRGLTGLLALGAIALLFNGCSRKSAASALVKKAALSVTTVSPTFTDWPESATGTGRIMAWQESIVGNDVGGLKLEALLVEVGDAVHKGDVLARFDAATVRIDVQQAEAAVAEAEANGTFATFQAERNRQLHATGAISQEQELQVTAVEKSSGARLASAKAQLAAQQLRLRRADVLAPDDGVISSRTATVGSVPAVGTELFRIILQSRLEWRATLPADQLAHVAPQQSVVVRAAGQSSVIGHVRAVSPTVDTNTLTGLLYIDLPDTTFLRSGMFATGEVQFGSSPSLHVPETALVYRDGYQYVMKLDSEHRIQPVKVSTGRRKNKDVEIIAGVSTRDLLVESGGGFLNLGDVVEVVSPAQALASHDTQVNPSNREAR